MIAHLIKAIEWRIRRIKQFVKVRYLKLTNNTIEIEGVILPLGEHLSDTLVEALFGGGYEQAELRTIMSKLDTSDIVMEIGSGIGLVSFWCAKQIGSQHVFTYEANQALEPIIRRTYEMNGVSPSLEICLLSDTEGDQSFYVEKDFWKSSLIRPGADAKEIKVSKCVLNEEIKRISPTFLIVDIEGGEYELFQYIDLHTIKKIAIELHTIYLGQEKVNEIKAILFEKGFQVDNRLSTTIKDYKEELFLERAGFTSI